MTTVPLTVVGVDVAAGTVADRACVAVALRTGRKAEVTGWYEARARDGRAPEDLVSWICRQEPVAIGIDAPQAPGERAATEGRVRRARSCDAELMRHGLKVYHPPARAEAQATARHSWLLVGWDLFGRLHACGFSPPAAAGLAGAFGAEKAVLEVYPHASFATLLGGVPPGKSTRAGQHLRVLALRSLRVEWDEYYDHDSLDALVAAVTAWRFVQGRTHCVGRRRHELIWLPVGPADFLPRYERLATTRDQAAALHRLRAAVG